MLLLLAGRSLVLRPLHGGLSSCELRLRGAVVRLRRLTLHSSRRRGLTLRLAVSRSLDCSLPHRRLLSLALLNHRLLLEVSLTHLRFRSGWPGDWLLPLNWSLLLPQLLRPLPLLGCLGRLLTRSARIRATRPNRRRAFRGWFGCIRWPLWGNFCGLPLGGSLLLLLEPLRCTLPHCFLPLRCLLFGCLSGLGPTRCSFFQVRLAPSRCIRCLSCASWIFRRRCGWICWSSGDLRSCPRTPTARAFAWRSRWRSGRGGIGLFGWRCSTGAFFSFLNRLLPGKPSGFATSSGSACLGHCGVASGCRPRIGWSRFRRRSSSRSGVRSWIL